MEDSIEIKERPKQPPNKQGTNIESNNKTLIQEDPSKTLVGQDKVDVLRAPARMTGIIDSLSEPTPDREHGKEKNHKDLLQTRIQVTNNKKRKRNEKKTTINHVSKKENQAKVRRLTVSELVK